MSSSSTGRKAIYVKDCLNVPVRYLEIVSSRWPPALAISLPVALLPASASAALLELALALLGLGDLPPVVLHYATVTRFDVRARRPRAFLQRDRPTFD
jgi:hypothetical protein